MADISPKSKRVNLNKSTTIKRGMTLNSLSDSESEQESPSNRRQLKLPEIILNKLTTTKANVAFEGIPGLKTTKNSKLNTKRAITEKKEGKRDYSVDYSMK